MPGKLTKKEKKNLYRQRLRELLKKYEKILLVTIDNVGANLIQQMRQKLRGQVVFLFGKNTVIRKTLRDHIEALNEAGNKAQAATYEAFLPQIRGNVGLVFTNGDLAQFKSDIEGYKQGAPARVGAIAPEDVFVPPGPTGMEPTQTQFLQSLNIASKIVKGQVEILQRIHLIKEGDRIGNSEAVLLDKLNIRPFSFAAKCKTVYDNGFVYSASLLELGPNDVLAQFSKGIQRVATVGLNLGIPSIATIPHYIGKIYKNILSVSVGTDYEFEGSKAIKEYLKDPSAFVVEAKPEEKAEEKPVEEAKPEEPEEESASIGGLFGSDDDDSD